MAEFRKDLVSGDWIIMAPQRGKRPHDFSNKQKRLPSPKKNCPFENLKRSGNWPPIDSFPSDSRWNVVVIPNKYPAISGSTECLVRSDEGPYSKFDGAGRHELVVTRSHVNSFPNLSKADARLVFKAFKERYRSASEDSCIKYFSVFANWGESAGASLYHPHYQMLGLPIIPPKAEHSLRGSRQYFKSKRKCVHCVIIEHELGSKVRIVAKNRHAVAIAPFAPGNDYEVRIFPKKHISNFEEDSDSHRNSVADLLQKILRSMNKKLGDPDYNFFIHSAPVKNINKYSTYHWHIEIEPKISKIAGFELSTGVDINTALPVEVAKLLRSN